MSFSSLRRAVISLSDIIIFLASVDQLRYYMEVSVVSQTYWKPPPALEILLGDTSRERIGSPDADVFKRAGVKHKDYSPLLSTRIGWLWSRRNVATGYSLPSKSARMQLYSITCVIWNRCLPYRNIATSLNISLITTSSHFFNVC